jgi:hypothetical protein
MFRMKRNYTALDVTSPTKNDGSVIINKNGTVTTLLATDFTGIDS